jgi:hypothetical protein
MKNFIMKLLATLNIRSRNSPSIRFPIVESVNLKLKDTSNSYNKEAFLRGSKE